MTARHAFAALAASKASATKAQQRKETPKAKPAFQLKPERHGTKVLKRSALAWHFKRTSLKHLSHDVLDHVSVFIRRTVVPSAAGEVSATESACTQGLRGLIGPND